MGVGQPQGIGSGFQLLRRHGSWDTPIGLLGREVEGGGKEGRMEGGEGGKGRRGEGRGGGGGKEGRVEGEEGGKGRMGEMGRIEGKGPYSGCLIVCM